MNQLIWRLHRSQAYFATGALAVFTVILVITGLVMANDYHHFLATCALTQSCSNGQGELFSGDGAIFDIVNLTIVVPLLFGLFWGAPLVSKELEDGTHNLMWTQGVTRKRWLSTNVMWCLGAAAIWGAAIALLVLWWRVPENALGSRFDAFDQQGIVPIAYSLFAVALGIAVGSFFKRVLPSIAATLGGFVLVRAAVGIYLRPHYMTPLTKTGPLQGIREQSRWLLVDLAGPREPARPSSRARIEPERPAGGLSGRSIGRKGLDRELSDFARISQCHHISAREQVLGIPRHRVSDLPGAVGSAYRPRVLEGSWPRRLNQSVRSRHRSR